MAPAALELLLLGLMHFALARLDIWHWKILKMLLQNSGILTAAAAFLPSTTADWCSWDGQEGWISWKFSGDWDLFSTCLPAARLLFYLLTSAFCQVVAPWLPDGAPAQAGVGVKAAVTAWELGAHKGRIPDFSSYSGGLLGTQTSCWTYKITSVSRFVLHRLNK